MRESMFFVCCVCDPWLKMAIKLFGVNLAARWHRISPELSSLMNEAKSRGSYYNSDAQMVLFKCQRDFAKYRDTSRLSTHTRTYVIQISLSLFYRLYLTIWHYLFKL